MKYLKNEELSKDAVMDVFEILPALLQKHKVSNFKSWLYSIAKNHCLMQLRKQKGIIEINSFEKIEHLLMESEEEVHLLNEKEIELQQLEKAITTLNNEQRKCIHLFYIEENSYADVVEKTGYELKKVKSYIQNGKRNLKLYLINNNTGIILIVLLHII